MTCQFVQRVERLYAMGRVVVERMMLCSEEGKQPVCQFTLQARDVETGTGNTPCEALADLECKLNIMPPGECLECGETNP